MLARILNNWPYKLLALAIAIVLRVQIGSALNPQEPAKITVPIIINDSDVPTNLVATSYSPKNVTVTLSGSPSDVADLSSRAGDIQATVNLERAHAGSNSRLPIIITLPADMREKVTMMSKVPNDVIVILDTKQHIVMSVHADPPTAPIGYVYQAAKVLPPTVSVDGPESLVNSISQLVVYPSSGDTSSNPGNILETERIVAVDSNGVPISGDLKLSPADAMVEIPIRKVGVMKSLVISPQVTGSPRFPLRVVKIDVDPENVVVSGPAALLAQTSVALTMPIDLTNQTDTFRQSVKLDLPSGVTSVQNPLVDVTVHLTTSPPSAAPPLSPAPSTAPRDVHSGKIL
jgi:YbbR domain-containing protein